MSTFDFTSASVAVTNHERKSARLETSYDGLAAHFTLTPDSDSATMTEAARNVVLTGAANDGTGAGSKVTMEELSGRNPGNVPSLPYWKAARTVRIGLDRAVKRANPTDSEESEESEESPKNLLTRAGLAASIEEVTAAWHAAQK